MIIETPTHVIEAVLGGTEEAPTLTLSRLSGRPVSREEWYTLALSVQVVALALATGFVVVSWEEET